MVIPLRTPRVLADGPESQAAGQGFTADQVPSSGVSDPVQRDWNARQWSRLQVSLRSLEAASLELDARLRAVETLLAEDTWDR